MIHKAGVNKPDSNNKAERLHGTMRERENVMRVMHNEETAQIMREGIRNHYNFIRPHQSLNGKTPAEVAGLDLGLSRNKLKDLIKKVLRIE